MITLYGVRVFVNPLCVTIKVHHEVHRHPIKKRRRGWDVVRIETREPAVYKTPMGLVAHPAAIARLRASFGAKEGGAI